MNPGVLYAQLLEAPVAVDVRHEDGRLRSLPVDRWLGRHSTADERIAAAVTGPVLDVGCGPGRLLEALTANGTSALGVDLSPTAVALARRRGARAILGNIFADVPRAGHWATALLLDGNVGIGGNPETLLRRLRALLRPGGEIVAEVEPPGAETGSGRVRMETRDAVSAWFEWAHVGVDGMDAVAASAGLSVSAVERIDARWFAWLA